MRLLKGLILIAPLHLSKQEGKRPCYAVDGDDVNAASSAGPTRFTLLQTFSLSNAARIEISLNINGHGLIGRHVECHTFRHDLFRVEFCSLLKVCQSFAPPKVTGILYLSFKIE